MSESNLELAKRAVETGIKIRMSCWDTDTYVYFKAPYWYWDNGNRFNYDFDFYEGTWQEYKEPKPERKFRVETKYRSVSGQNYISNHAYDTIKSALEHRPDTFGYVPVDVHVLEGE
jgi:hypothetical protein